MRNLILVLFCAALSVQATTFQLPSVSQQVIDLDQPGALEALERDNPKHYDAVMKKVDEVQTVTYSETGQHNLRLDTQNPFAAGRFIGPSDPAVTRLAVPIDDKVYNITVRYTKDPAHMVPAR